jgi:diguanylate cyclase (GGDEF)-like protein
VGVDVQLNDLNGFVASIRVSKHGSATLLDANGRILGSASNHLREVARRTNPVELRHLATHVDEKLRVRRDRFDGHDNVVVLAPIPTSPGWLVVVAAPESDFLGAQRESQNRLIRTALVVVVAAAVIGWLAFLAVRRRVDRLFDRANVDSLTRTLNRPRVLELAVRRLERNTRSGTPTTLCMLDIDGFKQVNDVYGHPAGDKVLRTIAERIGMSLRADDLFGRYGGEEFLVLFEHSPDDVVAVVDRLRVMAMAEPVLIGENWVSLTLSAGVAVSLPKENPMTFSELLLSADQALYEAKNTGRNRTVARLPGPVTETLTL